MFSQTRGESTVRSRIQPRDRLIMTSLSASVGLTGSRGRLGMRPGFILACMRVAAASALALLAAAFASAQTEMPAGVGVIVRLDKRLDALVPSDAKIEKVADGFVFLEGPVWRNVDSRLFYSDLRGNAIYQWTAADGVREYSKP